MAELNWLEKMIRIEERLARMDEKLDNILDRLSKLEKAIYNDKDGLIVEVATLKEREKGRDRRDKIIIGLMSVIITIELLLVSIVFGH